MINIVDRVNMVNISEIISQKSIKIYFQVILSPMESTSFSVEGFVRGIDPETGDIISPYLLFQAAKDANLQTELEKLCIESTFKRFKSFYDTNPKAILYINIGKSFFNEIIETNFISKTAKQVGIPRRNIVIDISNLMIDNEDNVLAQKLVSYLRKKGFYISIDDIGKNYNNIDRIIYFNPDVIKINHQMLNKLKNSGYRNLMIDYITEIAHKMGILVISTGVESKEDIISAMASGAQMIQGYYVSELVEFEYTEILEIINNFDRSPIYDIVEAQYQGSERQAITNVVAFINKLRSKLNNFNIDHLKEFAISLLQKHSFIESGYLLNIDGTQISDSFVNKSTFLDRNKELFNLYPKGTSHVDEDLFIRLQHELLSDWITRPFRSKLTNEVCVSAAFKLKLDDGLYYIAVLNIDYTKFDFNKEKINLSIK